MKGQICAVRSCKNEGEIHTCPYDGSLHGHGMIHYDCGYPPSKLKFHKGWHLICDKHFQIIKAEREEYIRYKS